MVAKKLILGLLIAGCTSAALAQMHGGGHGAGFGVSERRSGLGRAFYYGDPYLFADYPSGSLATAQPSPPIVLFQTPAAVEREPEAKIEPLLIELHGNRYVRVGGASSERGSIAPDYSDNVAAKASIGPTLAAHQTPSLPSVVLIYRDGHSEQVPEYAIVKGVIYTRGDYWRNGQWTKTIQMSALNIPATIQANQKQGVRFVLPAGPNEVVTRP